MKDYRTWWRKANDDICSLGVKIAIEIKFYKEYGNQYWRVTGADSDCLAEQLWAEREGLA